MAKKLKGIGTSTLPRRLSWLGYHKYSDYLKSVHWLSIREKWFSSDRYKGHFCHAKECDERFGLSLHHRTYVRLGCEEVGDLVLVCKSCHHAIHSLERMGMNLQQATRIICGK